MKYLLPIVGDESAWYRASQEERDEVMAGVAEFDRRHGAVMVSGAALTSGG